MPIVTINNGDRLVVFGGEDDNQTHEIFHLTFLNSRLRLSMHSRRFMVYVLSQSIVKIDWLFLVAKIDIFHE